jgi:hypothetical protein
LHWSEPVWVQPPPAVRPSLARRSVALSQRGPLSVAAGAIPIRAPTPAASLLSLFLSNALPYSAPSLSSSSCLFSVATLFNHLEARISCGPKDLCLTQFLYRRISIYCHSERSWPAHSGGQRSGKIPLTSNSSTCNARNSAAVQSHIDHHQSNISTSINLHAVLSISGVAAGASSAVCSPLCSSVPSVVSTSGVFVSRSEICGSAPSACSPATPCRSIISLASLI